MKKTHILIAIIYFITLVNTSCSNNSASDSKSETDNEAIQHTVTDNNIISKPSNSTLLFDASGSMLGYLNSSGDSRFIGVISYFENISRNTVVRLYGEKEGNPIENTEFDRMLNNRDIKWSNESDLRVMVQSMIDHIDRGDEICILLTDGILSGSNADIKNSPERSYNIRMRQKMSEDISSILSIKEGMYCALIARYKAKFNGKYSCYNNDGKRLINEDRPFFVIILGKWGCIKYIEQKLNEAKTNNDGINITTPYEDIVMIGDTCSYQKIKLSAAEGLNPKKGMLVIKKEFRSKSIALSADLETLPNYMQTDDYMNSNIELYVQRGQKAEKPLNKNYFKVSVNNVNGGGKKLHLSINSSQLIDTNLTLRLKYALPNWIEEKSDDNDIDIATNSEKLDKTFNLKYFIAGFTALHNGKYIKEQSLSFK